MTRFRQLAVLALTLFLGIGIAPRGTAAQDPGPAPNPALCVSCSAPRDGTATVRLVGGLPTDTWLDMSLDGEPIFKDLEYKDVGDYEETASGDRVLRITPKDSDDPVIEGEIALAADSDHTVAVAGTPEEVEAFLFEDDNTAPDPGEARIKLVHLAHGAPAVDVLAGAAALWKDVAYGSASEYIRMDAGTYAVDVREAGTDNLLLPADDLLVEAGHVYTLFMLGRVDGEPPLMLLQSADAVDVPVDRYALALPVLYNR